ncbi:MAG: hypothetical protein WC791_04145 [Candidatus Paceibacterota bacterium]|jgi:hypothetical protein
MGRNKHKESAKGAGHGDVEENPNKGSWDNIVAAAIQKPETEVPCIECETKVFPSRAYGHTIDGPICSRTCNETHKEKTKQSVGGAWGTIIPTTKAA